MPRLVLILTLLLGATGCTGTTITACNESDPVASCHKAHSMTRS